MNDDKEVLAESLAAEAANAAAIHAEAVEKSRMAQVSVAIEGAFERRDESDKEKAKATLSEAAKLAVTLVEHAKEEARQMLLEKGIDTAKIQLICRDVSWLKKATIGLYVFISTLGGGVIIALLAK